jgi:predicted metal-dependent enzyme (double-stranded beta helix superfamily)
MTNIARLRHFVAEMTRLVSSSVPAGTRAAVDAARILLADLVAHDDWIPDAMARIPSHGYAQNLLWCDPLERFCIVSFVWSPGARTPIHDHQVWGLVGMLRGSETSQRFISDPQTGRLAKGDRAVLSPGDVEILLPSEGDIHQVANALTERASISIHVYGGNIGAVRRHTFEADTGRPDLFVSGYTNRDTPNLWDRSVEARAIG